MRKMFVPFCLLLAIIVLIPIYKIFKEEGYFYPYIQKEKATFFAEDSTVLSYISIWENGKIIYSDRINCSADKFNSVVTKRYDLAQKWLYPEYKQP